MDNLPDIVKVLIFSLSSYVTLFIIAKVLGKKQVAQLSFIDYVVGISIGSIAAEMATETENPFYHYLIAMAIFLSFDLLITFVSRKGNVLKKIFSGKPIIIIENGKINYEELKKSKLTVDELVGMARDKDYFDINDIAFAIFETSGKLSILPKAEKLPPVCGDIDVKKPPSGLTAYFIVDGKFCHQTMNENGYTEERIKQDLNITDKEALKNILLASYDTEKGEYNVHYKFNAKIEST